MLRRRMPRAFLSLLDLSPTDALSTIVRNEMVDEINFGIFILFSGCPSRA